MNKTETGRSVPGKREEAEVRRCETASFLRLYGILYNYVAKIENSSRKRGKDVI